MYGPVIFKIGRKQAKTKVKSASQSIFMLRGYHLERSKPVLATENYFIEADWMLITSFCK
jgi:hypothetical protein